MSMAKVVCDYLGVEIGEEWQTSDREDYKIEEDGLKRYIGLSDGWVSVRSYEYDLLFTGKLDPVCPKDYTNVTIDNIDF